MTEERMIALLDLAEKRIQEKWLELVARLEASEAMDELVAALRDGRTPEVLRNLQREAERLAADIVATFVLAGEDAAAWLSERLGVTASFDQTNHRAVENMRRNRSRLVTELVRQQREAVTQALVEGIRAGDNPMVTARRVRQSIGLTSEMEQWVASYRRKLEEGRFRDAMRHVRRDRRADRTLLASERKQVPLTSAQVDSMVERYRQNLITYRGQMIARTESLRSAHEGTEEALRQAIDGGDVEPARIIRTWVPALDHRVRHSHRYMRGQWRFLGEPFLSGNGNHLMYPGDPNAPASDTVHCRCVVTTRIRPLPRVRF